jgi:hypothetical protein
MEQPEGSLADPRAAPETIAVDRLPQVSSKFKAAKRLRVSPAKLGGPERMKRALAVDLLYKPALRRLDEIRREEMRKAVEQARRRGKTVVDDLAPA